MKNLVVILASAAVLLAAPGVSRGVSVTLGVQNFTDGATVTGAQFLTASANEPAPFQDFNGSGDESANLSAQWTFTYSPTALVLLPTITVGIVDADASAPGLQVASFTLTNTVTSASFDLTALFNTAVESKGGANLQYSVYTITIPPTAYAGLAGGSARFALALQGPGLDTLGNSPFNGAGLDFSTLDLAPVPEPSSAAVALAAAGMLAACLVRRFRQQA